MTSSDSDANGDILDDDSPQSQQELRAEGPQPEPDEHPLAKVLPGRTIVDRCLVILTLLAIFYTLYFARSILLPITLAVMLNLVLKPTAKWLNRCGLPNVVAATAIFLLLVAAIGVGINTLSKPANEWLEEAPQQFRQVAYRLRTHAGTLEKIEEAKQEVEKITGEPEAEKVVVEQPPLSTQLLNSSGGFLSGSVIVLSLLFFLLAAGDQFIEKTVQVIPTWQGKWDAVVLIREIQHDISTYLGAITVINIGLGVVIGTGLWLLGLSNPVLWGVMACLLNYIPFAGLIAGTAIVAVVGLTEFDTLGQALLAPAIYLGANGVEANFVTPAMVGRQVSLNPVVVLLAIFLGGWLWGIGGIFLAVPMLIVLKIISNRYESLEPLSVFLAR